MLIDYNKHFELNDACTTATVKRGVTREAIRKYILHDLRTAKLRCLLRGTVPKELMDNICTLYNLAKKTVCK